MFYDRDVYCKYNAGTDDSCPPEIPSDLVVKVQSEPSCPEGEVYDGTACNCPEGTQPDPENDFICTNFQLLNEKVFVDDLCINNPNDGNCYSASRDQFESFNCIANIMPEQTTPVLQNSTRRFI